MTLYDYCVERKRFDLLRQWHPTKNDVTPDQVSHGSHRKVWWMCEKGHEWQTMVYAITSGCPYCLGRKLIPGENTLADKFPELAKQWHPEKNGSLTPSDVAPNTHRKAWWICEKGHEWEAKVGARVQGTGCPVCSNRQMVTGINDLATTHPEIAAQWHPTKNGTITPHNVVYGNHTKIWWRCEKGHEWQATILSRTSGQHGCPICAGRQVVPGENDMASLFPQVSAQWHPTKNGTITPEKVAPYSNRRVWWRCDKGHDYIAVISTRTANNTGCPYCSGKKVLVGFNDLATVEPKIAKQWHPELNGSLTPQMVTGGSGKKVWWVCDDGHVWKTVVYARTGPDKTGCPICAGKAKDMYKDIFK